MHSGSDDKSKGKGKEKEKKSIQLPSANWLALQKACMSRKRFYPSAKILVFTFYDI